MTDHKLTGYRGYEVTVTDDGFFVTQVDEKRYSSATLKGLHETLDKIETKRSKSRVLALAVINDKGESGVITGINMHTDDITTKGLGKRDRFRPRSSFYPDTMTTRGLVQRVADLQEQLQETVAQLREFKVETLGYIRDAASYEAALDSLEATHATALAKALEQEGEQ